MIKRLLIRVLPEWLKRILKLNYSYRVTLNANKLQYNLEYYHNGKYIGYDSFISFNKAFWIGTLYKRTGYTWFNQLLHCKKELEPFSYVLRPPRH